MFTNTQNFKSVICKKLVFILFIFLTISTGIAQNNDKRLKGIDKELNAVLETWKAAGFAVAVVEKDKIIYAKGFGYRDYENKLSVTPNTLFAIGSCSKAFTTSLLGIINKEGKLSFDDSPAKYIPELKFYNDELNSSITIKDMMTHRTGLPRHDYSWYLFPTNSKDSLIQRIEFLEPSKNLREQWQYNNFMYMAQGVIIEKITGQSWEDNIKKTLFHPLEMKRSNLSIKKLEKDKDKAFGYELKNETSIKITDYYHIAAMSPAGSINSSVNEMSNWVITWINGGKFKDTEIIPLLFVKQATSSQMVVSAGFPGKDNPGLHMSSYGYGWFISSYKGHYRVQHGGGIDGFTANTCFFPSDSIGIIVLSNQSSSTVPSVVRNIIADKLLGVSKTDWNKTLKEEHDKRVANMKKAKKDLVSDKVLKTLTSHTLGDYTGVYSNPGYGSFKIALKNDSLFAEFTLKKFWLKHYHYDIFETYLVEESGIDTTEGSDLKINFHTNNLGEISDLNVKFETTLDPLKFKRKLAEIKVDKETLQKYVGEYDISGTTIKIFLKGEKTLYVFVPGQPEYEMLATEQHKFTFKILDGYKLEFIEDKKGNITEVLFIQPNGTFKATKK